MESLRQNSKEINPDDKKILVILIDFLKRIILLIIKNRVNFNLATINWEIKAERTKSREFETDSIVREIQELCALKEIFLKEGLEKLVKMVRILTIKEISDFDIKSHASFWGLIEQKSRKG